jgi:protoporphyrinogen IX oxidase
MLWLIAFHIIAMVCWFAGLFYLPRLFVYHASSDNLAVKNQFNIMEHKLYYYITTPAAILTAVFGLWLWLPHYSAYAHFWWLHIKLILVLFLYLYHIYLGFLLRQFKQDHNTHSHRFYRILNEIPTVFLIVIVILAVVKPWS